MVCQLTKLIFKGTQVSDLFQCQITCKYAFVHAYLSSIDVHYVSNNEIKKLHGCRTKPASNMNYDKCQKMTYIYIMYFIALLPVSKNPETLPVYRRQ